MVRSILFGCALLATTCARRKPDVRKEPAGPASEQVLATVNGVPITRLDVRAASRGDAHGQQGPERESDALDAIIRDELAAQKAMALGLQRDEKLREELAQIEAQLGAIRRKKLADAFFREGISRQAKVDDAEARAYFERNASRIRTELCVWQILLRDQSRIEQLARELAGGAAFEEVAARLFPKLPPSAGKPWELGCLKWSQIPEPWREVVYGLEKGQTSGVISGPRGRYWIVKLIDRRENPDVTFESVRSVLLESLKGAKIEELRAKTNEELRAKAKIVYVGRESR